MDTEEVRGQKLGQLYAIVTKMLEGAPVGVDKQFIREAIRPVLHTLADNYVTNLQAKIQPPSKKRGGKAASAAITTESSDAELIAAYPKFAHATPVMLARGKMLLGSKNDPAWGGDNLWDRAWKRLLSALPSKPISMVEVLYDDGDTGAHYRDFAEGEAFTVRGASTVGTNLPLIVFRSSELINGPSMFRLPVGGAWGVQARMTGTYMATGHKYGATSKEDAIKGATAQAGSSGPVKENWTGKFFQHMENTMPHVSSYPTREQYVEWKAKWTALHDALIKKGMLTEAANWSKAVSNHFWTGNDKNTLPEIESFLEPKAYAQLHDLPVPPEHAGQTPTYTLPRGGKPDSDDRPTLMGILREMQKNPMIIKQYLPYAVKGDLVEPVRNLAQENQGTRLELAKGLSESGAIGAFGFGKPLRAIVVLFLFSAERSTISPEGEAVLAAYEQEYGIKPLTFAFRMPRSENPSELDDDRLDREANPRSSGVSFTSLVIGAALGAGAYRLIKRTAP
jgi:hypothetical protein